MPILFWLCFSLFRGPRFYIRTSWLFVQHHFWSERIGIFINVDEKKYNAFPTDATEMQINKWPWTKVVGPTLKNHYYSAKKQFVQTKS